VMVRALLSQRDTIFIEKIQYRKLRAELRMSEYFNVNNIFQWNVLDVRKSNFPKYFKSSLRSTFQELVLYK
jgi:hypothetical protein